MSDSLFSGWIGPLDDVAAGQTAFLVEISNQVQDRTRFELRDNPPTTNVSFKPVLRGWCGSWNDTSTYGRGLVKVQRVAKNGRAYVIELEGEELTQALDELGYPELTPGD